MRGAVEAAGGEPLTKMILGPVLLHAGQKEEAIALYADLARAAAGLFTEIGQVMGPLVGGDRDAAMRAIASTSLVSFARGDKECSWFLTLGFTCLGDEEAALDWLENTVRLGFSSHRFWSELDPVIAPLRRHPRFAAIMSLARDRERVLDV